LLSDTDCDGIAIATPAATHFTIAKKALLAGKDVFVEKPLSINIRDAQELIRLAKDHRRILMVDHILQYHPAIIKLKQLIDDGALGKLQYIYSNRLNIGKFRHEENILWSFAPHDFSVILALVGQEPEKVRAFGEAYLQDEVVDSTITHFRFKNRLKAHIFVSWLHPYKEQKLVVIGSHAMAVFDDMNIESKLVLYPHKIDWIKHIPVAEKAEKEVVPIENNEPLKEACLHFLKCMDTRQKPRTDGEEALAVLKVLQQAQERLDIRK
jgi:UDP-2-acetamido-3-amino-2,3-dideoxy-glucuronate N-acetyltransferase